MMEEVQRFARDRVEEINRRLADPFFAVAGNSHTGLFLSLLFDEAAMRLAGVHDSLELEDMLLLTAGVDSVCFARMGSPRFACRFNKAIASAYADYIARLNSEEWPEAGRLPV